MNKFNDSAAAAAAAVYCMEMVSFEDSCGQRKNKWKIEDRKHRWRIIVICRIQGKCVTCHVCVKLAGIFETSSPRNESLCHSNHIDFPSKGKSFEKYSGLTNLLKRFNSK